MPVKLLKAVVKKRSVQNIIKSIFDAEWYLTRYSDVRTQVAGNKTTPSKHYLEHGIYEGRAPNALFDIDYYKTFNYEDLIIANKDNSEVVIDYLTNVDAFGNSPHPLFDAKWYLDQNKQVQAAFNRGELHPYLHFWEYGSKEGQSPSPMFDAEWYFQNYPEARAMANDGRMTALQHYLLIGGKRGFSPSSQFDARWYLDRNQDVAALTRDGLTDALSHFLSSGKHEGRSSRGHGTSPQIRGSSFEESRAERQIHNPNLNNVRRYYALSKAPLVSVLIVNLDGERHLPDLAASLKTQSYRNFEIVFVDNGSQDQSCHLWQSLAPEASIVKLEENVGFAAANNIGLRYSKGELIALLNNDTKVDTDWLYSMVNTIAGNPEIGAVTSKVRFWTQFSTFEIISESKFSVNSSALLERLKYKKYFVEVGNDADGWIEATARGDLFELSLKLPLEESALSLRVIGTAESQHVEVRSGNQKRTERIGRLTTKVELPASERSRVAGKYVINNAGSIEGPGYTTADRGFGSYDDGQFETVEPISLLCGCSCLIRRDALNGRDIFISEFFAYFEDSELSQRLRKDGFQIFYCPPSKVYHKHSSTSVEKSRFWMKHVNRNQALYQYLLTPINDREEFLREKLLTFNHHRQYFSSKQNIKDVDDDTYSSVLDDIVNDLPLLANKITGEGLPKKNQVRIGVYNNFWQTLGGGEAHALSVVAALCRISTVEMISQNDFDIEYVLSYFGVEQKNVRKRIILDMVPEITGEYDVFVNSTYMSECRSLAKHSFYLVSFPSKTPTVEFLQSYTFFANSEFTLNWMKKIWGDSHFKSNVLYPAISDKLVTLADNALSGKTKTIISVGRFFASGHSKNQHIISEIFRRCVDLYRLGGWKLVLIGSSNDDSYVQNVVRSLAGYEAEVLTNVSLESLRMYYQSASVYIHAAGFGQDLNTEPENFEHFGMTVVEAAMNGCLPIVYDQAGPKEIVEKLGVGESYETIEQAVDLLVRRLAELDNPEDRAALAREVRTRATKLFHVSSSELRLDIIESSFNLSAISNI